MFAAPRKIRFALKALNLVDLMAIIPFYLELLLTLCGVDDRMLRDLRWAFLVVRILRVLRVIRIIKLGRFSSGLQTFGMTLKRSQKQLQMMTIVLLTGVVFFSVSILKRIFSNFLINNVDSKNPNTFRRWYTFWKKMKLTRHSQVFLPHIGGKSFEYNF